MNIGLIDSMISAPLFRRNLKRQRLAPSSRKVLSWSALLASAVAPALLGAEVARWEATETSKANRLQLERAADSNWLIEKSDNWYVARLKPSNDYYTRAAYHLSSDSPAGEKLWLVIEFLDRGYGLIAVSPSVPQTKQWGVARVNSGRIRRAVFQYDDAPLPTRFRVEGLDYLHAVVLTDQQPPLEPAPLLEPVARFTLPSERVTSAAGDAKDPDHIADAEAGLRNHLPLIRAIGFNGVESYVRWGWVERKPGIYDWSYYDAILDEIEKHKLQWFPMLMAGSGYALPAWLHDSTNNVGFKCLEHGIVHDTQSIFFPFQAQYASKFIAEFGKHYRNRESLLGIRLGPSGDFGEAQYPAKGPGYGFREGHTHIGFWAGDAYAQADFRSSMEKKYGKVERLNAAWKNDYASFDQVRTFLPDTAVTRRKRLDFADWYMGAMSAWCEQWAMWARQALPDTVIHQSSGGWGPVEIGTDYSYQARSMSKVHGGMRLTNEGDDFPDNFTITRMASSAARFYGIALGYEPGGFGTKRGVIARLFNAVTTGGVHLFYYLGNLTGNDQALEAWLKYSPYLDQRAKPLIDVAAFYPDASVKLDDELLRYRWGSIYFTVGRALREAVDFDYASEQMILNGALERYKVLLFLWGAVTEKPVLERIDQWVRNGGTLVFATRPRGLPETVEGDSSLAKKWLSGDTGKGRVIAWPGDLVPSQSYVEFVRDLLLPMPSLQSRIRDALRMEKPATVFWSVLENGKLALLNFSNHPATVRLVSGKRITIASYEMAME
jgi:hypothetical protein